MKRILALARSSALLAIVFGVGAGCPGSTKPEETPEVVLDTAGGLVAQGKTGEALALLAQYSLLSDPRGQSIAVDAYLLAKDYESAIGTLRQMPQTPESAELLQNACVAGAVDALEGSDAPLAVARVGNCTVSQGARADVRAVSFHSNARAGSAVDEVALKALRDQLPSLDPSESTDAAALHVEAAYLALHEREQDPVKKAHFLRSAFEVGSDPELGAKLIEFYLATAGEIGKTNPQGAADLYEELLLKKIPDLEISPEMQTRIAAETKRALFPVFLENFGQRYREKKLQADIAAGIAAVDGTNVKFTFTGLDKPEEYEKLIAWIYARLERPRPEPSGDFLGLTDTCTDRTASCTFDLTRLADWSYYTDDYEASTAKKLGVELKWPE